MEFQKSHHKFYESWVCYDKLNDCIIRIYHINKAKNYVKGVYHFTIIGQEIHFSSIINDMVYLNFDACLEDIYKWRIKCFKIE